MNKNLPRQETKVQSVLQGITVMNAISRMRKILLLLYVVSESTRVWKNVFVFLTIIIVCHYKRYRKP